MNAQSTRLLQTSRAVFLLLLALCLLSAQATASGAEQPEDASPAKVVQKFNQALLASMRTGKGGFERRYEILSPVIEQTFALPRMARIALGRDWDRLTRKQQQRYLEAFTDWTVSSYASQFASYSGEEFRIVSSSAETGSSTSVVSRLVAPEGEGRDFDYDLRKTDGGWRIVDIKIGGVSQLAMTRAQFRSVLKREGFDSLVAMLEKKARTMKGKDPTPVGRTPQ
ncbi:MAG: ABC transporter substrate-binding protein [Nitrospirota bacterium]